MDQRELNVDDGGDFDGVAVQERGPVDPLLDSFLRGRDQQGMATDDSQALRYVHPCR